jgi:hypothetical protein
MGVKAMATPYGTTKNDYLIMLKRNIAFVKILRNRRIHYKEYMDHDQIMINRSEEYMESKRNEALQKNKDFENNTLKNLYDDIGLEDDDDSSIIFLSSTEYSYMDDVD